MYPWSVSVNQWKIDKKEIYWGRHRISKHEMEAPCERTNVLSNADDLFSRDRLVT